MFAFQKKKLLQIQLEKKAHLKWVNKLLRKLKKKSTCCCCFSVLI